MLRPSLPISLSLIPLIVSLVAGCALLRSLPPSTTSGGDVASLPGWAYWQITARVWHDMNGNGLVEAGEPGVEYVRVILDDRYMLSTDTEGFASASLLVSTPDSPSRTSETFLISVDPPSGYQSTTPARLEVRGGDNIETILFGLKYDPALPPPAPRPRRALQCHEYPALSEKTGEIGTVGTVSDGTVLATWVTDNGTRNQIFRYDPEQDKWVPHLEPTDFNIHWLHGTSSEDLWAGGYPPGIYHRDAQTWIHYTGEDSLSMGTCKFTDLAIDGGGVVWAANGTRTLSFLPAGGSSWGLLWQSEVPDLGSVAALEVDNDGTLWAVGSTIARIAPTGRIDPMYGSPQFNAELFALPRMRENLDYSTFHTGLDSSGSLWIVRNETWQADTVDRFFRFDTQGRILEEYSYETTAGLKPPLPFYSFRMAKDGSIWADLRPSEVAVSQEIWPLIHFVPGATPTQGQWFIHEDSELPIRGSIEAVDPMGRVWLLGDQRESMQRGLVRCEEQ